MSSIVAGIASKLVLYGLPILEIALEQYAVHICGVVLDLIKHREERDVDDLKKQWEGGEKVEIKPNIDERTRFPKNKIDKLCFGSEIKREPFKHEYVDYVSGYYTADEVVDKIMSGTTPFAKSMRQIMIKLSEKKPQIFAITDEGYVVVSPLELFDSYNEHTEHITENKRFGIPTREPTEISRHYSYYSYYCVIQ